MKRNNRSPLYNIFRKRRCLIAPCFVLVVILVFVRRDRHPEYHPEEDTLLGVASLPLRNSHTSNATSLSPIVNVNTPELIWLMSFPNSGTSYTLAIVKRGSFTKTATNYGDHNFNRSGLSEPLDPSYTYGPYLTQSTLGYNKLPSPYILTKTHCGGRCDFCPPENYFITEKKFEKECLLTHGAWKNDDMENGIEYRNGFYNITMVKKAVHLYRNPFDNVVSRFHLHYAHKVDNKEDDWVESHPKTEEGFQKYCREMNTYDREKGASGHLQPYLKVGHNASYYFNEVPCVTEFFRYVQWHNLANDVLKHHGIESHILKYEDYVVDLDSALTSLFDFLELPLKTHKVKKFYHSNYTTYYSSEQRKASIQFMNMFSSKQTSKILDIYE